MKKWQSYFNITCFQTWINNLIDILLNVHEVKILSGFVINFS